MFKLMLLELVIIYMSLASSFMLESKNFITLRHINETLFVIFIYHK